MYLASHSGAWQGFSGACQAPSQAAASLPPLEAAPHCGGKLRDAQMRPVRKPEPAAPPSEAQREARARPPGAWRVLAQERAGGSGQGDPAGAATQRSQEGLVPSRRVGGRKTRLQFCSLRIPTGFLLILF